MTMADRRLLYTSLMLCLVHYGKSASITFSPPSPLLITANETQPGSGRPVTITCSHSGSVLFALNLFKNSTTGLRIRLVYAVTVAPPEGTNGLPQLDTGTSGTVTGSIAQGTVSLTYSQASCDTAGLYTCSSVVLEAGDVQKPESSAYYFVTVNPGQASITVVAEGTPSGAAWYIVGDVVILTCNIDVGTVEQTTEVNFFWQYEVDSGFGNKEFQTYPYTEHIETIRPQAVTQKCQTQTRISTLRRNLTIEDSERRYKCYVTKGGTPYEDQAGYAAISEVREDGSGSGSGSESTILESSSSRVLLNTGALVGVVVAVVAVPVTGVIAVVVIWLWHNSRRLPCTKTGTTRPEYESETNDFRSAELHPNVTGINEFTGGVPASYERLDVRRMGTMAEYSQFSPNQNKRNDFRSVELHPNVTGINEFTGGAPASYERLDVRTMGTIAEYSQFSPNQNETNDFRSVELHPIVTGINEFTGDVPASYEPLDVKTMDTMAEYSQISPYQK